MVNIGREYIIELRGVKMKMLRMMMVNFRKVYLLESEQVSQSIPNIIMEKMKSRKGKVQGGVNQFLDVV